MEKAKQARSKNEQGGEEDSVKLAVVSAMSKGTYGMVELANLNKELTGIGTVVADGTDFIVTVTASGRQYNVTRTGLVSKPKNLSIDKTSLQVVSGSTGTIKVTLSGEVTSATLKVDKVGNAENPNVKLKDGANEVSEMAVTGTTEVSVKATGTGRITITAGEEDPCYVDVSVVSLVTAISVKNGSTEVTSPYKLTGSNATFTVTTTPEQGINVEAIAVVSSDVNVATASLSGSSLIITGVGEGEADITIYGQVAGNTTANTNKKTITVEVQEVLSQAAQNLNKNIGKTVNYSVQCGKATATNTNSMTTNNSWKLFYANNTEVFIIPTGVLETSTGINIKNSEYNGSVDFVTGEVIVDSTTGKKRDLTYGVKYNKDWLAVCKNGASEYNNAKTVAYMCDKKQWSRYVDGGIQGTTGTRGVFTSTNETMETRTKNAPDGTYAVGGPTVELLEKSAGTGTHTITSNIGYNTSISGLTDMYKVSSRYWWLASPGNGTGNVRRVYDSGDVSGGSYDDSRYDFGVRPLVSIPLSSFQTDWVVDYSET